MTGSYRCYVMCMYSYCTDMQGYVGLLNALQCISDAILPLRGPCITASTDTQIPILNSHLALFVSWPWFKHMASMLQQSSYQIALLAATNSLRFEWPCIMAHCMEDTNATK